MRLLVVASMPQEFKAVLSHVQDVRVQTAGVDWARSARMEEHSVLLVANGAGPERAAQAVDAVSEFHPDAMMSVGFCGAVAPELGEADVVVATEVIRKDATYPCNPLSSRRTYRRGVVRTLDHIAESADEKAHWYRLGAVAVEMEASAVAEKAHAHNLPFHCVKTVTDLAGETLQNDLNSALREDGHFDTIKILGSTLRQPFVRVPELFRLLNRSARAAQALGDFFADCRF
jgi:adenosylhomocysteine nucleosidase